jgi:hypothetical protein
MSSSITQLNALLPATRHKSIRFEIFSRSGAVGKLTIVILSDGKKEIV